MSHIFGGNHRCMTRSSTVAELPTTSLSLQQSTTGNLVLPSLFVMDRFTHPEIPSRHSRFRAFQRYLRFAWHLASWVTLFGAGLAANHRAAHSIQLYSPNSRRVDHAIPDQCRGHRHCRPSAGGARTERSDRRNLAFYQGGGGGRIDLRRRSRSKVRKSNRIS